jgi:hypothetical protein
LFIFLLHFCVSLVAVTRPELEAAVLLLLHGYNKIACTEVAYLFWNICYHINFENPTQAVVWRFLLECFHARRFGTVEDGKFKDGCLLGCCAV